MCNIDYKQIQKNLLDCKLKVLAVATVIVPIVAAVGPFAVNLLYPQNTQKTLHDKGVTAISFSAMKMDFNAQITGEEDVRYNQDNGFISLASGLMGKLASITLASGEVLSGDAATSFLSGACDGTEGLACVASG
ncbi:MAG: hypothetical protein RLN62_05250 [Rickettsiales bacterium]